MKRHIRILGIDDGPFSFTQHKTIVVGIVMRADGYIEGVLRRDVDVDGNNSTDTIIEMVKRTRHRDQLRVIMLDGIAFGGFNIVDIDRLYNEIRIPIITVTREMPDFDLILETLKRKFEDWEERWDMIKDNKIYKIETTHNPIFVSYRGVSIDEAKEIIKLSTIRGVIPEPIRVAHMVASGIVRGESYGKA